MFIALRDMTWSSASQTEVLEALRVDLQRVRQVIDGTMDIHTVRVVPQLLRMRRVKLLHLSPVDEDGSGGAGSGSNSGAGSGSKLVGGPAPLTSLPSPVRSAATARRPVLDDRSTSAYAAERLQAIAAQTATSSFENAAVLDEDDDRVVGDTAPSAKGKLSLLVRRTLREIADRGVDLASAYSTVELACKEMVQTALSAYEAGTPECDDALQAAQTYVRGKSALLSHGSSVG